MTRLFLHITARWHQAMALRAAQKAQEHVNKCLEAHAKLIALDLDAGGR